MMKPLTPKENELMQKLWTRDEMTARELMEMYKEPRPHINTISTFLRILEEKGWVKHRSIGTTNLYKAVMSKEEMGFKSLKSIVSNFFHGSLAGMVSSLIEKDELNTEEIDELMRLIKNKEK